MTEDPRLVRAWNEQTKLRKVLSELLDQIDSLEGYELTRDTENYKAQANWDSTIQQARDCL